MHSEEKKTLLQKDIAARLGVSKKTISKWECGNGLPEVVYMEPLCQILGITVNELLAVCNFYDQYYDSEGRLSQYPNKRPRRQIALSKIADCFEKDRKYTEKEVNEIIRNNIGENESV